MPRAARAGRDPRQGPARDQAAAEEVYASIESPKGELGFYCVSNGTNRPYRMHVRPPSFINLQALPRLAKGHLSRTSSR